MVIQESSAYGWMLNNSGTDFNGLFSRNLDTDASVDCALWMLPGECIGHSVLHIEFRVTVRNSQRRQVETLHLRLTLCYIWEE